MKKTNQEPKLKKSTAQLLCKVHALIECKGRRALLPQNLPDEILKELIKEDEDSDLILLMFTMAFMQGKDSGFYSDDDEIYHNVNVMSYFLHLEELRRAKILEYKPFPTVKNIFTVDTYVKVDLEHEYCKAFQN